MKAEPLQGRKRDILAAVVQAHIITGEPVSSSSITRRSRLPVSSATVRNEMASLEEAGYLRQPHTSAGRVPTPRAYEFYAREVASNARLSPADQKWIHRNLFPRRGETEPVLARVPHVLSELCHGVGLLLVPPLAGTVLSQVRFVALGEERLLAVVVSREGRVCDKVVRTQERFRADELSRMSAYLNTNFRGWTLGAIRQEMERRVNADRSRFLRQAAALCEESLDFEDDSKTLQMEGMVHLIEQIEGTDPEALRELLQALEEKERLARLLTDCLESPESPVRVLVGLERVTPAMKDFALVGARYCREPRAFGSLGLLGPARMNYARAITAVSYVATLFDRLPAEN